MPLPATSQEIQLWVLERFGFKPEPSWIAHCRRLYGLEATAALRAEETCPAEKQLAIKKAFEHFGMLA